MVKNLNTIERSERIRVGKYTPNEQAINSIIINASSELIDANTSGFFVSPVRYDTSITSNTLVYDTTQTEIVDSGVSALKSLDDVVSVGNVTSQTVEFQNTTTSFITYGPVGISNSNPIHTLDVGSKFFVDENGSNIVDVHGNVHVSGTLRVVGNVEVFGDMTLLTQQNLLIGDSIVELGKNNYDSNTGFDLGFVMTRSTAVSNVGIGYREAQDEFFIGYTNSSAYEHYLTPNSDNNVNVHVYGNVTAVSFFGDGTTLDGVALTTDLVSNVERIATLETDLTSNVVRIGTLETDLASNNVRVSTLETDLASNVARIGTLETDLASNNTRVSTLETDLTSNVVRIGTLETDLASNNVRVSTLETDLASNVVRIGTLETDLASNNTRVSTLETDLTSNVVRIGTLETDLASNNTRVSTLETDLASNAARIGTLEIDLTSNVSRIGILETDLASNASRVGVLETDLTSNVVRIGTLESQMLTKAPINNPVFTGIVTGDGGNLSNITLEQVTSYGNTTSNTIYLTNITTSLVTDGDVGIGTNTPDKKLHVAGDILADVDVYAVRYHGDGGLLSNILSTSNLQAVTDTGNTTSNTIQFTNPTTAFTTDLTSNVGVKLDQLSNVTITTPANEDMLVYDGSNWTNQRQDHLFLYAKADGVSLNKGDVVYATGTTGNNTVNVDKADARDPTKMPAIGVVYQNLLTNEEGLIVTFGRADGMVLDGFLEGQTVYVSNTIPGGVSNVVPHGEVNGVPNLIQNVGIIVKSHPTQGIINVTGVGRTNAIPNANVITNTPSYVYTDGSDDTNTLHKIAPANLLTKLQTLQQVTSTGNTTSNTIQFTNPTTAFTTDLTSNVGVNIEQLNNVTLTTLETEDMLVYDGTIWRNQKQNHTYLSAKANVALNKGTVVYATGAVGNNTFVIDKADARDPKKMPAIGILYQTLSQDGQGLVVTFGRADAIALPNFKEGETVYVSNTVPGTLSNVTPIGIYNGVPNLIQNVGLVVKPHATQGVVSVTGVGRVNAIPNANVVTATPAYVYTDSPTGGNSLNKIVPTNLLTKLQTLAQVVNTGNTVSNTINVTGLTTTGNVNVGSNVSIIGLTQTHIPFVSVGNYLVDSPIRKDNGSIIISADTEINGNLIVSGNSYIVSSNNVIIEDRILGLANNNPSHDYDIGIIMEHPGHNVALIHHGDEDRFSMGYTQNTVTDTHVLPDSNIFLVDILGNLVVQNNITVATGSYYGDGTTLTGVALESDLVSNVVRIGTLETNLTNNVIRIDNLETDLGSNVIRIGNLESNLAANVIRIGNLETDLGSNVIRIENLESNLAANVIRIDNLETDLGANVIRIGNLETDLGSNVIRIGNLESNLGANVIRIGTLETDLSSNAGRIGVLETDMTDNVVRIGTLETDLGSNVIRIGTLETDLSSNAGRISVLETDLTDNVVRIGTLETGLTDHVIRIENLETDLASNSNRISTLTFNDVVGVSNTTSNTIILTNPTVGIVATGNIEAAFFLGDGGLLSNVSGGGGGGTSNLQAVTDTGNTTSNTIILTNPTVGIVATGNIEAAFFLGDGGLLSNVSGGGGGGTSNLQAVTDTGNTTSNTIILTNPTVGIVATGNIEAAFFLGDGSALENIQSSNVTNFTSNVNRIISLETNLAANVIRIGNLETNLSSNANRTGNLETNLAANVIRIGNLETDLGSNASRIGTLENGTITIGGTKTFTNDTTFSSNISVVGLSDPNNKYLTMIDTNGALIRSPVLVDSTGKYIITASEAEFLGNITLSGNTTIIASTSTFIGDRIFGVGSNNSATNLDSGFMIEHQDGGVYANVGLIYHAVDHKFTIGYTQSTFTDDHIDNFTDADHVMLVEVDGNLLVQNNITVATGSYYGDGTTLTGVALASDLISNVVRIGNLETNMTSNASRIGVLETNLTSNASRIGVLETNLTSNASRIGVLETNLTSNASRIGVLETDLASNASRIGVLETNLTSNASRIGVLETDLASNSNRISTLTFNDVITVSNSTSNTIQLTNPTTGIVATGNIQANYFIGDGGLLSNISEGVWTTSASNIYYTSGNVGIGTNTPTSNLHVHGGTIINSDQVAKKTYSFAGQLPSGQSIADSKITITFSNHVFYAKIVAHLVEGTGESVSVLSLECCGGDWDGDSPVNNISLGPQAIFGSSSTNPWNSALTTTSTTVSFAPTSNMSADSFYNIFIEYISQSASGVVSTITEGTSSVVVTFTY